MPFPSEGQGPRPCPRHCVRKGQTDTLSAAQWKRISTFSGQVSSILHTFASIFMYLGVLLSLNESKI